EPHGIPRLPSVGPRGARPPRVPSRGGIEPVRPGAGRPAAAGIAGWSAAAVVGDAGPLGGLHLPVGRPLAARDLRPQARGAGRRPGRLGVARTAAPRVRLRRAPPPPGRPRPPIRGGAYDAPPRRPAVPQRA